MSGSTAMAKIEAAEAGKQLSVGQRKAFLEVASRTDLDKLPDDQRHGALIAFGNHTGLRPELGEVMIYQGRFYVTMAGRIRNAHANGLMDGMTARPASAVEKRNAGYEDEDIVWITDVRRKGSAFPYRGWGKVTRAEIEKARAGTGSRFTPIAQHPVEMARKRSEYDALRLAFPIDEQLTDQAAHYIAKAEEEVRASRARTAPTLEAEIVEEEIAAKEVVEEEAAGGQGQPAAA